MRKRLLPTFLLAFASLVQLIAAEPTISLQFHRTGTDAQSVTISVTDTNGSAIEGATATFASSHALKGTGGAVTEGIVCPNVNGNTSPNIEISLAVNGLPEGFSFNRIGLDIHALNGGGNYQERGDNVVRQWNVAASTGSDNNPFGGLNNIDIAAGVGTPGAVHQMWYIDHAETLTCNGALTLKLTITAGATNRGCFFGLSEVTFTSSATTVEPDPMPEPDDEGSKVYYIQWKNTGTNHITEGKDTYLTVSAKSTSKAQFWKLIATERDNCYYIRNAVTGRYLGSCNMTPASASRVTTSATPVEYYIGATTSTEAEIAGCHYLSSTDCADYDKESAGPRALNKDGASDYVITWQAGTSRKGSYWKLVETTDTFVKPQHTQVAKSLNIYFNPCGMVGNNFLTSAKVYGEGALDHITYEATSKPSTWHVPYAHDYGKVVRGSAFDISIALKDTPTTDLKTNAYFDWDADGEFETAVPITLNGATGTTRVAVPNNASEGPTRMRLRINSNGLNLAEDDVEGFVYDFRLYIVGPQEGRTVSVSVNANDRGYTTLSATAKHYEYGTTLTAKATPKGNATFVCWREEGVVVSTNAEYTFTVDRNVSLKAYFTPNTMPDTHVEQLLVPQPDGVRIDIRPDHLIASAKSRVCALSLYTIDAALVAHCNSDTLYTGDIAEGLYIIRATAEEGYANIKIYLDK